MMLLLAPLALSTVSASEPQRYALLGFYAFLAPVLLRFSW
jgi:hypothetical protein